MIKIFKTITTLFSLETLWHLGPLQPRCSENFCSIALRNNFYFYFLFVSFYDLVLNIRCVRKKATVF